MKQSGQTQGISENIIIVSYGGQRDLNLRNPHVNPRMFSPVIIFENRLKSFHEMSFSFVCFFKNQTVIITLMLFASGKPPWIMSPVCHRYQPTNNDWPTAPDLDTELCESPTLLLCRRKHVQQQLSLNEPTPDWAESSQSLILYIEIKNIFNFTHLTVKTNTPIKPIKMKNIPFILHNDEWLVNLNKM